MRSARVFLLLAIEAGIVAGSYRLGRLPGFSPHGDVRAWLRHAPVEELVASGARLVALVTGCWLLASTLACLVARSTPGAVARPLRAIALPSVRRLVDRAVAVGTLAGSGVLVAPGSLAAAEPAPVVRAAGPAPAEAPLVVREPAADPVVRAPASATSPDAAPASGSPPPRPEAAPSPTPAAGPDLGADRSEPAPAPAAPATHVVERGEHLWGIAEDAVRTARPGASTEEVGAYWVELVQENRPGLASGDPDLVHPGEVLVLPPLRLDT